MRYELGDHLGSSSVVVSETGGLISREEYRPYGESSFGSYAKKRYRFTGKERDEESGLYYHGARYYSPWLCRWTAPDPAGMVDGVNVYAYVRGNPVRLVDPGGMEGEEFENAVQAAIETVDQATDIVFERAETIDAMQQHATEASGKGIEATGLIGIEGETIPLPYQTQERWLVSQYDQSEQLRSREEFDATTAPSPWQIVELLAESGRSPIPFKRYLSVLPLSGQWNDLRISNLRTGSREPEQMLRGSYHSHVSEHGQSHPSYPDLTMMLLHTDQAQDAGGGVSDAIQQSVDIHYVLTDEYIYRLEVSSRAEDFLSGDGDISKRVEQIYRMELEHFDGDTNKAVMGVAGEVGITVYRGQSGTRSKEGQWVPFRRMN
ncbi:RHS repeat-associated core domain-containing protein [Lujinxingia litoralis]|uniref:RHS repeat-associated core domain-containing protein n=1 Tax=Lujinxingia litoralis TaxID=2211119 RepID=UPI0018F47FC5|nr:RHS repeat-associated core domain-containing protein [Lujinxingia litoralis]